MDTLLQSVPRLEGGRFEFFLFPRYSCARYFSLDANRIAGTTSPEPEHPPDYSANDARVFYCFSRRGDVSTVLLNPPGSSRFHPCALYRALAAGRGSAMAAARLSRGRGWWW